MKKYPIFLVVACYLLFATTGAVASDFTSSSFRVMDPVLQPAGYATSASYSLVSTIAQIAQGTSTSALWEDRSGFLYFPFASTPALSVTAGDGSADLSWSASVGTLGWTISGYDVGLGTALSGPFAYTSVGNILSHTLTGLTNGTPYYVLVRARDAFGYPVASSSISSVTPTGSASSPPGGGGGGGGYTPPQETQNGTLTVSGVAYPRGEVAVLVDGVVQKTIPTDAVAAWSADVILTPGPHQILMYGKDAVSRRSASSAFNSSVPLNGHSYLRDIIIPPTFIGDKAEVLRGDIIALTGASYPFGETILMFGPDPTFTSAVSLVRLVSSATDGRFTYRLDTKQLPIGTYSARVRSEKGGAVGTVSSPVTFSVGEKTTPLPSACLPGDLNGDLRVDLVDFSIAVYWYKRPMSEAFKYKETQCLNADGKIDLYDFSLMAYYWTG